MPSFGSTHGPVVVGVGALLGNSMKVHHWSRVDLGRVDAGLFPLRNGALGMYMAVDL